MYETVADADPEIRGGGGGEGLSFFFHFGLKIRGGTPLAPPLDPPL